MPVSYTHLHFHMSRQRPYSRIVLATEEYPMTIGVEVGALGPACALPGAALPAVPALPAVCSAARPLPDPSARCV